MTTYTSYDQIEAERRQERVAAGQPHGLSADEVEAARRTGADLARYAALKGVPLSVGGGRSVQATQEALRPLSTEEAA